jgi:hypothetical protein
MIVVFNILKILWWIKSGNELPVVVPKQYDNYLKTSLRLIYMFFLKIMSSNLYIYRFKIPVAH